MAKEKKQEAAPEGAPAWMATYSDLVTLLMCFFVLLFAFSSVDAAKFQEVMNSFKGGSGPLMGGTSISEDANNMDGKPEMLDQEPSETSYRAVMVKVEENKDGRDTPKNDANKKDDKKKEFKATATNGDSKDPRDFEWQSSNPEAVVVDEEGNITIKDIKQTATVFAKDKDTQVVGAVQINSEIENPEIPDISNPSDWSKEELEEALRRDLIPDSLKTLDMQVEINRREFAGVSLKIYEALSAQVVPKYDEKPFLDTDDEDVLRAYSVGITKGVEFTLFEPDAPLNRETAATMLTRAYKKSHFKDWTLETDDLAKYKLNYKNVKLFRDDKNISAWAKPSVYFMVKNGIIKGVGGNVFAPKSYASQENAIEYATMTREQAVVMGLRMVENLGE